MKQWWRRWQAQTGFTLLELLVVISIIGILIAMGSVAYVTAQRRGRDAKRRGDVKAMQSALEQYYSINSSSYGTTGSCADLSPDFMASVPADPQTGDAYTCDRTGTAYCVSAVLETADGNCGGCGVAGTENYCLTNLQ